MKSGEPRGEQQKDLDGTLFGASADSNDAKPTDSAETVSRYLQDPKIAEPSDPQGPVSARGTKVAVGLAAIAIAAILYLMFNNLTDTRLPPRPQTAARVVEPEAELIDSDSDSLNLAERTFTEQQCQRMSEQMPRLTSFRALKINDAAFAYFCTHPLQSVDLSFADQITRETVERLAKLKSLKYLSLRGISLGDGDLVAFSPSLVELDLSHTRANDSTVQRIRSSLPALKKLNLAGTNLSSRVVPVLSQMQNLERLDLSGCDELSRGDVETLKQALASCYVLADPKD